MYLKTKAKWHVKWRIIFKNSGIFIYLYNSRPSVSHPHVKHQQKVPESSRLYVTQIPAHKSVRKLMIITWKTVALLHFHSDRHTASGNPRPSWETGLVTLDCYEEEEILKHILLSLQLLRGTHLEVEPLQSSMFFILDYVAGTSLIYISFQVQGNQSSYMNSRGLTDLGI